MYIEEQKRYIFGALFALSNRARILGNKIDPSLTIKQWLFIAIISSCKNENSTISELALIIGSSHQNVKKMALILEKRGFVRLYKDEKDARITRLEITQTCRGYFLQNNYRGVDFMENLLVGFSRDDIAGLFSGMKKLEENIIRMEQENENPKEER
jgi:DNA-binding MarR family transcriptional regulator